jgi:thymidylate kinase
MFERFNRMNVSLKLIYFFGADGSGKTTHANLITTLLKQNGVKTWRASVKYHHTLSFLLLKLLITRGGADPRINYYGFSGELANKIRLPWKILELLSLLPVVFYRVLIPSFLGYIVICDRYLLDSLVTLSYFLKDTEMLTGTIAQLLVKLIPKKSLLVYFKVDTDLALSRKTDEPLSTQLIEYYKKAYGIVVSYSGLPILSIDTSDVSIEQAEATIVASIKMSSTTGQT